RSKGAMEAIPYAVITMYEEMKASKDLVLVRGEMMDVNVLPPQLKQLWTLLKIIYLTPTAEEALTDGGGSAAAPSASGSGASLSPFDAFPRSFNRKPNPSIDFDAYT